MPLKEIVKESKSKMSKAVDILKEELRGLRTGRASTGLVEHIRVDYYGSPTPLNQLATLATPQGDTILIKPFDPSSLHDIEKAIKASDLSIAPIVEGKMIRLNVPPLSEERRKQLSQQAKQLGEQTKVSVRNVRRDAIKHLEKEEKDSVITEDDLNLGKKQIDDITKQFSGDADKMIEAKSEEIMTS